MENREYRIGNLTAVKVWELDLDDFALTQLLPEIEPDTLAKAPAAMDSRTYDRHTGKVKLSVHSWLLRGGGKTILIDTCGGNDKNRPKLKALDHLRTPYLARLLAAGARPEEIDYVLLTHLHADHVGWNTRLVDDCWTPTFPNATILCSGLEWRYVAALAAKDDAAIQSARTEAGLGEPIRTPIDGVFQDSLAPIEPTGRLRQITVDEGEVLEGIRFLSAPGHSIDHAAIAVSSQGEQAIFGGDIVHHPLEMSHPELVSMFCEFPNAARASRRRLLDYAAENGALFFSSHFPASSVGRVTRDGASYHWKFFED
ncbi:MBL fold metallo-hydrolase [uncultured Nostoc sp.]|uniref:MBL fold metallo-hydrolase n=1 Tax=uncultured Nostoc sp. TaxID=340711 RepID=UPI0035CC0A8E